MKVVAVLVLLALLAVASAHKDHKGHKANNEHDSSSGPACTYTSTDGRYFDLRRLSRMDLITKDVTSGSTFHFNPCGAVHTPACPLGTAVCEITNKGVGISHGSAATAAWADGVEQDASVEVTYGGGEVCSEGLARKTVVELRCTHGKDPNTVPSVLMGVTNEDCFLKLTVQSPVACDTQNICSAISNEVICRLNPDLCNWDEEGRCVAAKDSEWSPFADISVVLISALTSFCAVIFFFCSIGCLCLVCCSIINKRKATLKVIRKKNGFTAVPQQDDIELTPQPTNNFIPPVPEVQPYGYQSVVMMQQADGTFVPIYVPMPPQAYSHPMAQLVPQGHIQQQ